MNKGTKSQRKTLRIREKLKLEMVWSSFLPIIESFAKFTWIDLILFQTNLKSK